MSSHDEELTVSTMEVRHNYHLQDVHGIATDRLAARQATTMQIERLWFGETYRTLLPYRWRTEHDGADKAAVAMMLLAAVFLAVMVASEWRR